MVYDDMLRKMLSCFKLVSPANKKKHVNVLVRFKCLRLVKMKMKITQSDQRQ